RDRWPAFAGRMDKALDEAEIALEFRLATLGNNVGAGLDDGEGEESAEDHAAGAPCHQDDIPFDPEFALKFLKWREDKRRGRSGNRGPARSRPVTEAELTEVLETRLRVVHKRYRAQGWSEDENGHLIPPGWVRKEPPPPEDGTDERDG